ncbi:MAG: hypothetical protein IPL32_19540 [Chloracidobacterium sp.]|nr:hypothetical protein [Chloracidobacterium sp.]
MPLCWLGEMRSEPNGGSVLGNGGLLIQPKGDIFYSFADSRGGDALECWAWCTGLSRDPRGGALWKWPTDMLLVKGIEIERPTPAVDLLALCDAILTTDLGQFVPDELKAQRNGKPEYRTASTDRQIITRILQIAQSVAPTTLASTPTG